jgi:ABC-2 type transport system permease protein
MSRVLSIARREIQSYFNSPVAYIVLGVFLFVTGYLYFSTLFISGFASLRNFFGVTPAMLIVFAPALTMRLVAEERKSGTIEHLLTLPVTDTEVVLGKFLAAMGTLCVGYLLTIPYGLSVAFLTPKGLSLDLGPVIGGYFGLVLLSASFLSLGLFASSLTRNQIVAFIIAFLACFFFYLIDRLAIFLPASLAPVFEFLSVDFHFANITRGVIDTRDILFYVSLTSLALMFTVYSLRRR